MSSPLTHIMNMNLSDMSNFDQLAILPGPSLSMAPGQPSSPLGVNTSQPVNGPSGQYHVVQPPPKCDKWLKLEVCREFVRGACSRVGIDCRYAHPAPHVLTENGNVTACYDSIKDKCTRENCKYFHPPKHLKTQLEVNGRNNLQKQKAYIMSQVAQAQAAGLTPLLATPTGIQMVTNKLENGAQHIGQNIAAPPHPYWPQLQYMTMLQGPVQPYAATTPYAYLPNPLSNLVPTVAATQPGTNPLVDSSLLQKIHRTDRMEVCREFQRRSCVRGETECRYAHPSEQVQIDQADNSVIVCMDFIKQRCQREKCKYYHPPGHLAQKVKTAQQQATHTAYAAQAQFVNNQINMHNIYMKRPTMTQPSRVSPAPLDAKLPSVLQAQYQPMSLTPSVQPTYVTTTC